MKRSILLIVTALLLLCACQKEQATDASADELAQAVIAATAAHEFRRADDDFTENCFEAPAAPAESAVYFASDANDTCEFGVFRLTDTAHAADMMAAIHDYLESERAAVESLAALYPGDELEARLARYRDATVGASGNIVYYFAMEPHLAEDAQSALLAALS
ncbi:MAG: hypothetical protein IJA78_00385 [Clostridia bacterium]|nr:hypothetical protein [Clostridia bacterium]